MVRGERSPLILVVEDERQLAETLERHLQGRGFAVRSAGSVTEAWNLFWECSPDLVLLDVMLPDGLGFEFCAQLRRQSSVPVIYLTALGEDAAVVRGLRAGGDDYLAKPFSMDVLSAHVDALLRRSGKARVGRIDLPPLSVDLVAASATLEGRHIDLSKKELQLLTFFAANVGGAFTQEELLAAVWSERSGLPTNTVRQHISRLRNKLHLDEASAFELAITPDGRYVFKQVRFSGR